MNLKQAGRKCIASMTHLGIYQRRIDYLAGHA